MQYENPKIEYFEIEVGKRVEIGPGYSQDPRYTYALDDFVGLEGIVLEVDASGFVRLLLDSNTPIRIHAARLMEPLKVGSVWHLPEDPEQRTYVLLTPPGSVLWERNDEVARAFRENIRTQCDSQAKRGDTCIVYSATGRILDKWKK